MRTLPTSLLLLLIPAIAVAGTEAIPISPAPEWVLRHPIEFERTPAEDTVSDGVYWLLVDTQVRIEEGREERYSEIALKVLDESGANLAGTISIDFDPEYESLVVHAVDVVRDESRQDRYRADRVQMIRRETELEAQLYDGRLTFNLVLDDLRVGDVVNYAYTVSGANPIFRGTYSDEFYTEWDVPVESYRFRLLWPEHRPLNIRAIGTAPQPIKTSAHAVDEYTWASTRVPAKLPDGNTPGWYSTYAGVQLSEWASWQAVVEWALPLYAPDLEAVEAEAERLRASGDGDAARLIAALRLTQDSVRYVAFEMGRGSHEPRPPAQTLRQRFGDCKDKSLLLVSLLRALGISASPALVHSSLDKGLLDRLPTPLAFDHVIVEADLGDRRIWVDPTSTFQRGDIDHIHQPDFGYALPIRVDASKLVEMAQPRSGAPIRSVEQVLDLSSGDGEPADFSVRSVYRAAAADDVRAWLANQSAEAIDKSYLNYYASNYPGIRRLGPVEFDDDEHHNEITIRESYQIDEIWQYDESTGRTFAEVLPQETIDLLEFPYTSVRTTPLAIDHPVHLFQQIEVRLPGDWNFEPSADALENDAVAMTYSARASGSKLRLTYSYRTKTDHIVADAAPGYLQDLEDFYDILGYRLSPPGSGPINWALLTIYASAFVIGGFIARRLYLFEPKQGPPKIPAADRLEGLGGWLAFVGLAVIVIPFRVLYDSFQILLTFDASTWIELMSPAAEAYHPLWAPFLILEVAFGGLILPVTLVLLLLFITRRLSFPILYRGFLVVHTLFQLFEASIVSFLPDAILSSEEYAQVGRNCVIAACWFLYLGGSKRVAATFTRRRISSEPHDTDGELVDITT